jgi:nucleoid DNA-binding protein
VDFINFHIAYLLTKHECVIIPDFGAFVVLKVQDDPSKRRGFILPPIKYYLTFNPEIIQDDGLLVHSIEKEKNTSYTEALHLVNEFVNGLVEDLRTGQMVQFPWIGKIHLSNERKIVFTPAKNLSCNASNCGLENLNFPYLNDVSENKFIKKHKKQTKRLIFYIILAVIILLSALLFIFLFSKPLDKNLFSHLDALFKISIKT